MIGVGSASQVISMWSQPQQAPAAAQWPGQIGKPATVNNLLTAGAQGPEKQKGHRGIGETVSLLLQVSREHESHFTTL